jgi:glycosyltransferase involved in cell wall biosynthesis
MIKKDIKVCFFSHSSLLGGAERSMFELIKLLQQKGIKCSVVMEGEGSLKSKCIELGIIVKSVKFMPWWCGINYDRLKMADDIKSFIDNGLNEIVDFVKEQDVDIIYTQTIVNPFGAIVAEELELPHFWAIREYGERDHRLEFVFSFDSSMRCMYDSSEYVFCVSKDVARVVLQENSINDNVVVNYSLVDIPKEYKNDEIRVLENSIINIGIFGSVTRGKNQKDIIKAILDLIDKSYNINLYIVGQIDYSYKEELLCMINRSKYKEKIIFKEHTDNPIKMMSKMDVVVSCAVSEAMGRTLFEAIHLKKPIIYSKVGGALEIFEDGIHGLGYKLYNSNDLAKQIAATIDNPNKTKERVKNAYSYISSFDESRYIQPLIKAINESLVQKPKRKSYKSVKNFILDQLGKVPYRMIENEMQKHKEKIVKSDLKIDKYKQQLRQKEQIIQNQQQQIEQLHALTQSMRIKNRVKRFIPISKLQKAFGIFALVKENPQVLKKAFYYIKKGDFAYLIVKTKEKFRKNLNHDEQEFLLYQDIFTDFDKKKYAIKDEVIDIVIPVYNGFEYLESLFKSIKDYTTSNYRLIVVDDASPDERVKPFLKDVLKEFNHLLIENEKNLGFVQSVNKAVKHVQNHFVILNTDTEVPSHWLGRLMYPMLNQQNIATTTPFTNAGTIASFPKFLEDNEIFENLTVEELDSYFKTVDAENLYEEVPTGVGFCMGINYELVKKIGLFDEKTFAKGYGEENDWCQRAIQNGYKNLLVPNLFVYHKHGGSFLSEDKKRYIEENLLKLIKKHPNYQKDVDAFIEKNPYQVLRDSLVLLVSSNQNDGLYLIIDHMLGGGANSYRDELIEEYRRDDKMTLKIVYDFYANRYKLFYWYKEDEVTLAFESFSELKSFLLKLKLKEIFVNELVSHADIFEMLDLIQQIKVEQEVELIVPIHDFYPICPSFTLLNDKGNFCNVPDIQSCKSCMKSNNLEWKTMFHGRVDIQAWRDKWGSLLSYADKILCFSNSSKSLVIKAYPEVSSSITVIPHVVKKIEPIQMPKKDKKEKVIGILGAINYAKGTSVIKELIAKIESENLDMHVVLIGELSESIKSDKFTLTGRYKKEDLPNLIIKHEIDIFLIPSIWPETFSYTTQEIMMMQLPLMVFDLGAPAERVKKYDKGIVLKDMSVDAILNEVFKHNYLKSALSKRDKNLGGRIV